MHSLSKRINGSFTSLIRHVISISPLPNLLKTHYCGQITSSQIGSSVTLSGWLTHVRHIGPNLHFLVLRDETGSSQVLFNTESVRVMGEDKAAEIGNLLKELSVESVVCVNGTVQPRPKTTTTTTARESEETQVEVLLHDFKVLNACSRLPFTPSKGHPVPNEEYRLQHRYMDLRRPQLNSNIRTRSTVAHHIRSFLHERGLVEIETPLLFKSTPEGAREFIVPSRSEKGEFYALPQSPQQYKQILMASGFEKYYQLAKCFRDESQGAGRQPEFTQLDLELAFATQASVMGLIEELIQSVWERFMGVTLTRPFQKMEYEEAMRVYGSDKPDTRFGLHITDVTPMLDVPQGDTEHVVEYILIRNAQDFLSVKESDTIKSQILSERFPHLGDNVKAQDLLFVKVKEDGDVSWQGKIPFLKGLSDSLKSNPGHELCSVKPGDMLILNRRIGGFNGGTTILGRVRSLLGLVLERKSLHGVSKNSHSFLWVHSFPMFTPDPQSVGGWSATHHPFTAPLTDDSHHLFTKTNQVRGQTYDLVYNGVELGGGSIRIHEADLQRLVLTKILGLSEDRVNADFGHLLGALTSGCPPHGGIALGFDRLLSILCQTENIRSVIAFPKWAGRDLMVGAPSKVRTDELKEFGISVKGQE